MAKDKDKRETPAPVPSPPYDVEELFPDEAIPYPSDDSFTAKEPDAAVEGPHPVANTNADRGALTQLLSAAQQCGLTVNVDAIIEVRDRELPAGRYQKAFDTIARIYVQVSTQITQRQAELRHREIQFRSGALKMSIRQWMLLQRQETEKTQRIDRARRNFTRVLDGLTVLRAAQGEKAN